MPKRKWVPTAVWPCLHRQPGQLGPQPYFRAQVSPRCGRRPPSNPPTCRSAAGNPRPTRPPRATTVAYL